MVPQRPPLVLRHRDRLHQHVGVAELLPERRRRRRVDHLLLLVLVVLVAGRLQQRRLGLVRRRSLEVRWVEAVEGEAAEEAAGADVDGALEAVEGAHVDVEEDGVVVGVAVGGVDAFEPLRELDVAEAVAASVHHEANALPQRLRVVDVVVAVEVEDEGAIGHDR
ncbi:unnamed protein product [Spirodela intermedia]|uniref:Uncharacterized protein n=1 Tax=Spirodela intermedia TaxID=51605 RepID=A0A7I8LNT0_SPIIN|nr:unnamed protein product [Spirodela intermedia]